MYATKSTQPVANEPETGRWGRAPVLRPDDEPALEWEPVPTFRARLRNALNLPTLIGIAVFGVAIIVTAAIMLRGLTEIPETLGPDAQQLPSETAQSLAGLPQRSTSTEAPAAEPIFVHIVGEVVVPGVLELPAGSRVTDAIAAAGGATPLAKLDVINLARVLTDGEQVVVPDALGAEQLALLGPAGIPNAPLDAAAAGGIINLNNATAEQLQQLPRIGPSIASRIIEWRDANGGFGSVDQLLEVSGIGEKTLDQFRDRVGV